MEGRITATIVRRSLNHYTVPVLDLRHLKAIAIMLELPKRPAELMDVHQSPDRSLTGSDLSRALAEIFPTDTERSQTE
jgi:hypothetical protein